MAVNLIADFRDGSYFNYTVPTGNTVSAGEIVLVGAMNGIALTAGAAGDVVPCANYGVWEVDKPTGFARTQGQQVYLTASGALTTVATGTVQFLGFAWEAAAAGPSNTKIKVALRGFTAQRTA